MNVLLNDSRANLHHEGSMCIEQINCDIRGGSGIIGQ